MALKPAKSAPSLPTCKSSQRKEIDEPSALSIISTDSVLSSCASWKEEREAYVENVLVLIRQCPNVLKTISETVVGGVPTPFVH